MKPFERNTVIKAVEDVKRLAERLAQCPELARSGQDLKEEAWGLADSLADVEGSMRQILDVQLPKLMSENLTPPETFDLLLDIGEDFRRILYHVLEQQSFYRYLVPEGTHIYGPDEASQELPKRDRKSE
jgi:hypothetical protein